MSFNTTLSKVLKVLLWTSLHMTGPPFYLFRISNTKFDHWYITYGQIEPFTFGLIDMQRRQTFQEIQGKWDFSSFCAAQCIQSRQFKVIYNVSRYHKTLQHTPANGILTPRKRYSSYYSSVTFTPPRCRHYPTNNSVKNVQNGQKWSKTAKIANMAKIVKNDRNGKKWSGMIKNGQTW